MSTPNVDEAIDGGLGQSAIQTVTNYLLNFSDEEGRPNHNAIHRERDWPVSRKQIHGLRHIAGNEPTKLAGFVDKQAEKDNKTLAEIETELKDKKARLDRRPQDERLLEQKAKLENRKQQLRRLLDFWNEVRQAIQQLKRDQAPPDHYSAYFQRFCAHYLYEMTKRTQGE